MNPPSRGGVLVTGASGFVGSAVIRRLLADSYPVTALTHRRELSPAEGLRRVAGNLLDAATLDRALDGCRAVIHLVGIIREIPRKGITFQRLHFQGTRAVVAAASRAGVRRFVQMSALGARADAPAEYHRTKHQAEECVRNSGLDWTIFRPSMIVGPGGEFWEMEKAWARGRAAPFVFMPYFGAGLLGTGGAGNIQPVFVEDVARAFVEALENPKAIGQIYSLGGNERMTWPAMHRAFARAMVGRERLTAAVPAWWAKVLTYLVPGRLLPFNRDQVYMSQEENTCDMGKFVADFGWEPRGLGESLASGMG
jgi:uncharacterized protein YbjT (DUF2867 family)